MSGRSSITRNPDIQAAVDQLIAEGASIDDIAVAVADYGISRSAVGRYARRYRPLVEGIQRDNAIRQALRKHLPDGVDTALVDVALYRAQAEVLRTFDGMGEEDAAASPKEVAAAVRALKALVETMRHKKSFEREVREDERRKTVEAAERAARRAGASAEVIATIRKDILMGVV